MGLDLAEVIVTVPATTYKKGAWIDKYGHKHKAKTVHRDKHKRRVKRRNGKKKTPKEKKFFKPRVKSGWHASDPPKVRRQKLLKSHKGNYLAAARAKQELANVSTDPKTVKAAQADADYFFKKHRQLKGGEGNAKA